MEGKYWGEDGDGDGDGDGDVEGDGDHLLLLSWHPGRHFQKYGDHVILIVVVLISIINYEKMDNVQLLDKHLIEVEHGESGVDCNPCNWQSKTKKICNGFLIMSWLSSSCSVQ